MPKDLKINAITNKISNIQNPISKIRIRLEGPKNVRD